jgi:hypothetical protein
MSDHFNFSRLSLLLKNHLVEHKQKYLYYIAGMFFIGMLVMILIITFNRFYGYENVYTLADKYPKVTDWEGVQTALYLGGLAIFGIIFSSVSFVNFNNKGEAIFYLIKPASQFEKWLVEIIVHVFLFFFAYTFVFYLIDIPVTWFIRMREYHYFLEEYKDWTKFQQAENLFHASDLFHFGTLHRDVPLVAYPICISIYVTGTAFFLYGAVLYNRFSFFKTLILGFVTAMVYVFYSIFVSEASIRALMPENWNFQLTGAYNYEQSLEVTLSEHWLWVIAYALMFIVPAVVLACSYFKLKEKEV